MQWTHAIAIAIWLATSLAAAAQMAAGAKSNAHSLWQAIGKTCTETALKAPSEKAVKIAGIAKDEFYYYGGHRIDSNGRLFSFGVIESEQEENDEKIESYRLGYLGWWQVLRYWRLMADSKRPIDAAKQHLRLRGFADASAEPADKDVSRPTRMTFERALQALDAIDETMALSPVEKEIMREALIRAAINDVPWSAAFVSAVMRQAKLDEAEFEFSEAHSTYIYRAFETSLAEVVNTKTRDVYRACPLSRTVPRPGDLVCYHRHIKEHGTRSSAEIRGIILADLEANPKKETIHKAHCDVVAHVDRAALKVYVVGGNVQQAVTVKKLALRRSDGSLSEVQPDGCKLDGGWTFPGATQGKPVAPHLPDECSLNRKPWFVLLQVRS